MWSLAVVSVSADTMVVTVYPAPTVVETEVPQADFSCMAAVGRHCIGTFVVVVPPSDTLAVAPEFESGFECLALLRAARLAADPAAVAVTAALATQLVG